MIKRLSVLMLPLVVAACATEPTGPLPDPAAHPGSIFITTPYSSDDFAWSQARGSNGIRGRSPTGYSCAGMWVGLTPDGPYSRERILKLYGSAVRADRPVAAIRNRTVANDNPGLARYVRSAKCDAEGRFSFDGLPDGGYFLIAQVGSPSGPLALMRHVNLRGGDVETVGLTITPVK